MSVELLDLRVRLEARAKLGFPLSTVEKDYAISYFALGVSRTAELSPLHFKGGTLLRKVFFAGYRFSEDLDYTSTAKLSCDQLLELFQEAAKTATDAARAYSPLSFAVQRVRAGRPHPMEQCQFKVMARFPWQRSDSSVTRLKLEVAVHEHLHFGSNKARLVHEYDGERLEATLNTYALSEVVVEKIRAFGQVRKHLEDKGWVNPRVRDLYDLWWVTTQQKEFDFDWKAVRAGLDAKCPDVGLAVRGRGDFEDAFGGAPCAFEAGDLFDAVRVQRRLSHRWQQNEDGE